MAFILNSADSSRIAVIFVISDKIVGLISLTIKFIFESISPTLFTARAIYGELSVKSVFLIFKTLVPSVNSLISILSFGFNGVFKSFPLYLEDKK